MLLKLSEKNVFVVDIDTECRDRNTYWGKRIPKNKFTEYFITRPLIKDGNFPNGIAYSTYYYGSDKWSGDLGNNICALYLGDVKTLNDALDNKYTSSPNFQNMKKVYFDPNCKYPRFKLSETTNIKRCLNPGKADCVIMNKIQFKNSKFGHRNIKALSKQHEVTVLYSKQENHYYIIPTLTENLEDADCTRHFKSEIKRFTTLKSNSDPSEILLNAMKNAQVIAHDSQMIYTGSFFVINNDDILTTVEGLLNNYMLITYDTDLDKFVSQGLQQVTDEDVKALSKMLSSSDDSVKGMGIKLLSNYDIQGAPLTVGSLIIKNFGNVEYLNEIKSVGFQQVLSTLNLDISRLKSYGSKDSLINSLYAKSTNDVEKTQTRNMLIDNLSEELNRTVEKRLSELSAFGFNVEIKIT